MAALMDDPAGSLVAGAGVGMPGGHLAPGHHGRRAAVRAGRRQDVVDECNGVGGGHGRIPVTMEDDQRQGAGLALLHRRERGGPSLRM